MSKEILKLENVEKKYSGSVEELHIINNLSFSVEEGEFISILGRSGSGKSTLLNIMGLLDRVDSGKILDINIIPKLAPIIIIISLKDISTGILVI